jgi:hypothetical protein
LILLDFSKAFDKVPHKRLLYSLNGLGPLFGIESHCSSLLNTDENWQFKMSAFLLLSDCVIPVLSFQSWINKEVKSLSRKKKRSYDKARRTGNAVMVGL